MSPFQEDALVHQRHDGEIGVARTRPADHPPLREGNEEGLAIVTMSRSIDDGRPAERRQRDYFGRRR